MILFDTHAHYDDKAFDGDRDELIQSLPSEGIGLVLNAGSGEESSAAAVGLAEKYEFIYASAGVHPIEAHDAKEGWQERIIELAGHRKCRAIGEIGLDYHYDFSPRDVQKSVFDQQLSIAESLKLPVIIHQREAFSDTLDILKCHPGVCGVFHCFSGGCETAKTVLDMGFYISLGGTITFKNAKKPPEVMAYVPSERIMLETDCPYLAPHPYRGRRNDSTLLHIIAEAAAKIRGCTVEEIAGITYENGKRLFCIL
jgi:TatD DNase family protein